MTQLDERTATVPFAVTDPWWIDRERYYDRTFFELERDRLWNSVWQMACRLEEIPAVGDYVEYTICDQSVLVVRTGPEQIKGYYNACRHRATQLALGCGSFRGGQIVCPFHGWRWNIDGSPSFIYGAEGFAAASSNAASTPGAGACSSTSTATPAHCGRRSSPCRRCSTPSASTACGSTGGRPCV